MPRKKTDIYRRITKSHLQAIGHVAAAWSLLELSVLSALSSLSGVRLDTTITLAGPGAFASWLDMLKILTKPSSAHVHKRQEIDKLSELLKKLLNRRNSIVHAVWQIPRGSGIINYQTYIAPTATGTAQADGFPKRGTDWIKRVAWSSKQMRLVAAMTEKCRLMLLEIHMRTPPASPKESHAQQRLRQSNLRRIRLMLDTLPNPYRK